ncbi:WD40-repeat-containing domain protein [Kockovaella imperatae]|uniref:WD40-repeat-containing domain protein n=1 Tax=Kockovaella imperatae TaxID=4999 RepID=A0A1Y1UL56_9TREE|nr:WD40-repeat-containing domain protein [Kockovaella imperatae]ORX38234.1 WD40-repeat-containing domain protein [Kockovaella imperatae]
MGDIPFPIAATASSSSSLALASGSSILLYRTSSGSASTSSSSKPSDPKNHPSSFIRHIAISPDEKHIAALTEAKQLLVFASESLEVLSRRSISKRGAHLSFGPKGDIILTDKVGDVYRYPLVPRVIHEDERPGNGLLTSDPSRNVDADLLLGHVSLISMHLLSEDGKHIITADRDEHIRVSRFPQSFVIERYLFGSEKFVSALCIPSSQPSWLISGGGESVLRTWDWTNGNQLGTVDLEDVLPYRTVRSTLRKDKKQGKRKHDADNDDEFERAPEGWTLPSGRGICIKKITSMRIGEKSVIIFFSSGCRAIHSFELPSDCSENPRLNTLETPYPVLDFAVHPRDRSKFVISMDTTWGTIKTNAMPDNMRGIIKDATPSEEDLQAMRKSIMIAEVSDSGTLSNVSSTHSSLLDPLLAMINNASLSASSSAIASLDLYDELSLYPRWPGFEEDDDLAGPADDKTVTIGDASGNASEKTYSRAELEKMNPKQLGRLKAKGVDIGDLMPRKKKKQKLDRDESVGADTVQG